MRRYKVLDTFSYLSRNAIDIEQLEEIFHHGIDDMQYSLNGYYVKKYADDMKTDIIEPLVNELKNENKDIAVIFKNEGIVAIIGYRAHRD